MPHSRGESTADWCNWRTLRDGQKQFHSSLRGSVYLCLGGGFTSLWVREPLDHPRFGTIVTAKSTGMAHNKLYYGLQVMIVGALSPERTRHLGHTTDQ